MKEKHIDSVTGPCFLSSTNVLQWTSSCCAPWKNFFKTIRENLSFYYITAFGWKRSHFTNAFGQCFCNISQLQCNTAVTHQFLFLHLDTLPPGGEKINTLKMLESFFFFHFSHSWWCSLLKTMSQLFLFFFFFYNVPGSYEHSSIKSLMAVSLSSSGFPCGRFFAQCVLRQPLPSLLDPNKQVRKERNAVTWVGGARRGWATLGLRNNMRIDRT